MASWVNENIRLKKYIVFYLPHRFSTPKMRCLILFCLVILAVAVQGRPNEENEREKRDAMTLPTEQTPTTPKICRKSKEEQDKTDSDKHLAGQTTKKPNQECDSSEESSEEKHRPIPAGKQKRQANPATTTKRPKTTTKEPHKIGHGEEDRSKPKGKQDVPPTATSTHRPPPTTPKHEQTTTKHVGRKRREATTTTKKPHTTHKPAEEDRSKQQEGKQNPIPPTTTTQSTHKPAQG